MKRLDIFQHLLDRYDLVGVSFVRIYGGQIGLSAKDIKRPLLLEMGAITIPSNPNKKVVREMSQRLLDWLTGHREQVRHWYELHEAHKNHPYNDAIHPPVEEVNATHGTTCEYDYTYKEVTDECAVTIGVHDYYVAMHGSITDDAALTLRILEPATAEGITTILRLAEEVVANHPIHKARKDLREWYDFRKAYRDAIKAVTRFRGGK